VAISRSYGLLGLRSEYLHKTQYSMDKWMEELRAMMEHIKSRASSSQKTSTAA
jgi:hypothetical protein